MSTSSAKKTLLFEGAGITGTRLADVENCRLRTRLKNKDERIIYLEIGGTEVNKYMPNKTYKNIGRVDHCFYEDIKDDKKVNYSPKLKPIESIYFEYTKEGILKLVNEKLNCDFEALEVSELVQVHDTKKPIAIC